MSTDRSRQRAYWDDLAKIDPNAAIIDPNDDRGLKNAYLAAIRDHAFRQALDSHGISAGLLIDVGCGTGSATRPLMLAGHQVLGVDISMGLLRHARLRCGDSNCLFVAIDGQALPVLPARFDAAVVYVVLSYLLDDAAAATLLSEIRVALRPGAPLIMIEQVRTTRRVCEDGKKVQRTLDQWKNILEAAGFTMEASTILRHGRFPTTPLIRIGLVPRMFWQALRKLEAAFAMRFGILKWDYAEVRFVAKA